jgi:pyruvate formate-lyase activating enzyme-like uncharacterized protein
MNAVKTKYTDNHSPGCMSCQNGKWLCIYLTYLCPAHCRFCPSPFKNDQIISPFGTDRNVILDYLKKYDFNGIGFSGGDPFVKFNRLVDWLYFFKCELPQYYFWAYTSGITITQKQLEILSESGLDELRFNIAATGYNSEDIIQKIERAVKLIPGIAVEIPSIAEDYDQLIRILPTLDRIGVKYLNLHEYISAGKEENEQEWGDFLLNKVSRLKFSLSSLSNTKKITNFCKEHKLRIKLNNCSLLKKEEQIRQRRLRMGNIFKNDSDFLNDDGIIVRNINMKGNYTEEEISSMIIQNGLEGIMKNSEFLPDLLGGDSTTVELDLLPPLTIDEYFRILNFKINH